MDILELIKSKTATRKYRKKTISKKNISKIIDAGIWGPSIRHIQPWKFIIIQKKSFLNKIVKIFIDKSKTVKIPGFFLEPTINVLSNVNTIIVITNSKDFTNLIKRIFPKRIVRSYLKVASITELSAIAASVQNMMLVSQNLGIGTCWLSAPLFCEEEIKNLIGVHEQIVSILALGYPKEKGKRSPRKPFSEAVKFIK
jgi:nitroreductase